MKQRVLVGILVTVAVLLLGVVVMFAFGAPQQGQVPVQSATVASGSSATAGGDATAPVTGSPVQPGSTVTTGEVPAPDPSSPLMIEIPGCVCHSDDPALVKQHQGYRMNQCFGCHKGGMPEMGQ